MALSASLQAEFGQGGFDLSATFSGLSADLDGLTAPEIPLDVAAIDGSAADATAVDAGVIAATVEVVLAGLEAVGAELPIGSDLSATLRTVLDGAARLGAIDIAASRESILDGATEVDASGIAALEAHLGNVAAGLQTQPIQDLTGLVSSLVPGGLSLDGLIAGRGSELQSIGRLVHLVGAMMAVHTQATRLHDGVRLIVGMMDAVELAEIERSLRRWVNHDLAGLVAGIDPGDPQLVDIVADPILAMTADVRAAAEALRRGFGFGHATLAGLGVADIVVRLDATTASITEHGLNEIRLIAERLAGAFEPALGIDLPDPGASVADFWSTVQSQLDVLAGAITTLDPAKVSGAVTRGFGDALGVIGDVTAAAELVVVNTRAALETVRLAVTSIDLGAVADAISAVLEPVADIIDRVTAIIDDAQATIEDASAAVVAAMDAVRGAIEAAADTVATAFDRITAMVDALDLANLQENIESAIAPITAAVGSLHIAPVFDTAIDVIDTTADVVGAVPLDLLPGDAKSELAEAIRPVKEIDFEVDVADVLNARLAEIVGALDTDVLGAVEEAYAAVIDFLESVDPATPLAEIEAEVFEPFLAELRALNPQELLAPLDEALTPVRDAIAGFQIDEELLAPIDEAIDAIQAELNALSPAALLAPLEEQAGEVLATISSALQLEQLGGYLDSAEVLIAEWLATLDPQRLVDLLGSSFASLAGDITSSNNANPLGSLVALLAESTGLRVRGDSLHVVSQWISGHTAGAAIQTLVAAAAEQLESLQNATAAFDLAGLVAELQTPYRSLHASVVALPPDSPLRIAIEVDVQGAAPLELLGPFADSVAAYNAGLKEAAKAARAAAGSSRSQLDAVAAGLRDALRPLTTVTDWMRRVVARFGVDAATLAPRSVAAAFLADLTPDQVLAPFLDALNALLAKLGSIASDGVIAPLREVIVDVESAIAAFDIGFIATELNTIHAEVVGALDGIRPAVALGPVLTSLEEFQATVAAFDPLQPVTAAIESMTAAIEDGAEQLRPTVVFAPVLETYASTVAALGALDVRALLEPLLAAIEAIAVELSIGLDDTAVALGRLQDALPDAAALEGGSASASASLSIGI